MGIFDWLTNSAGNLISSVGNIIDDVVTTDEEKKQLKIELTKEINAFKLAIKKEENTFEKELTQRQTNDMQSDSWLSKNVRPMALIFLTFSVVAIAVCTIFILEPEEVKLVDAWTPLFTALLVVTYGFYFGSRGGEKITKMITAAKKVG